MAGWFPPQISAVYTFGLMLERPSPTRGIMGMTLKQLLVCLCAAAFGAAAWSQESADEPAATGVDASSADAALDSGAVDDAGDAAALSDDDERSRFSRAAGGLGQALRLDSFSRSEDSVVADPFETWNRGIYAFNATADRYVLEPAADAYRFALPRMARDSVRSFIDNLKSPVWFANDVMQGEWNRAGITARRFALNSTVGVAGLYDFADNVAGLPKHDEDFGQTLAVWGVDTGPYVMLPILGPSTVRDASGLVVDVALDPFTWAEFEGETAFFIGRTVADTIDIRERVDQAVELTRRSADPYAQVRATYIQSRERRIANGGDLYDTLPDFDEDFE